MTAIRALRCGLLAIGVSLAYPAVAESVLLSCEINVPRVPKAPPHKPVVSLIFDVDKKSLSYNGAHASITGVSEDTVSAEGTISADGSAKPAPSRVSLNRLTGRLTVLSESEDGRGWSYDGYCTVVRRKF